MPLGLDPNDPRVRSVVLKELIEDFWKSDIGQYMKARAQRESDAATVKLVENAHKLTVAERVALQGEIWRASKFCEWLEEAYDQGCADLQILEEEHDATR
jgi:hypothetical protein